MSGQRKALIVANDEYENEGLRRLRAPAADAEALGRVLGDPQIGDFAVQVVRNEPSYVIQEQIEEVFTGRRPDDVVLLHFSGYGLKSESGELFFAASNTRPNRLGATAVSAEFVQRCMRESRSRAIVLLLDCSYGGAFSQGVTVRVAGDVNVLDSFPHGWTGVGRGRAVITASNAMEFAFEGNQLAGNQHRWPSVFTSALIEGLATGEADRDEDGWVSLTELYDYVFDKVREENPHQTLSRQVELAGELYVARSGRRRDRAATVVGSGRGRGGIFISYRREETAGQAGRLYDRLSARYGHGRVFMDVRVIDIGSDFTGAIEQAVSGCDILLALIGQNWSATTDSKGERRIDDPDDFVRVEIETALQRDIWVVPVLVDGAALPQANDLPPSLRPLIRRQVIGLSHASFQSEVTRLEAVIDRVLGAEPPPLAATEAPKRPDRKARREAAQRARREEAERKAREEAEQRAREEAERKAREEAERKAREEAERKAREEAEQRAREEAEQKAREEAEREAAAAVAPVAKAQPERETPVQAPELQRARVFLCYRREDTQWSAGRIYDNLASEYGQEQVFRDIDSTRAGTKYSAWIESRVSQSSVMIVLIGDAWLSATNPAGQRRLDSPRDWVRREIEAALKHDIPIIPVRIEEARLPSEEELPPSIVDLLEFQDAQVTDRRWAYDVGQLIEAIDGLHAPERGAPEA